MKKWLILGYCTAVVMVVSITIQLLYSVPVSAEQTTQEPSYSDLRTEPVVEDVSQHSSEPQPPTQQAQDFYHLAPLGDMVALFDESGKVVEVYDIYLDVLPPEDVAALSEGIVVKNESELRRLLEDFGG